MTDWIPGQSHWDQVLNKAIEQLQREVDALKAQAAPTPEPSEELRLLRELAEAARDARTIRHYTAWLDYALAALDAAEGEGR